MENIRSELTDKFYDLSLSSLRDELPDDEKKMLLDLELKYLGSGADFTKIVYAQSDFFYMQLDFIKELIAKVMLLEQEIKRLSNKGSND